MENNKKFYTTIKLFPCVNNSNGNPYTGVTAVLNITNVQRKDVNGKALVTARAAINNRAKTLNAGLNSNLVEDNKGAIWADVCFWEDRADRFQKFLGDRERALVCIMGTISVRRYNNNEGAQMESVSINADEWFAVNIGSSAPKTDAGAYGVPQPSIPLPGGDDDLPY